MDVSTKKEKKSMDVEISISLSLLINKLQDLCRDKETSSNPRLQKETQTAIKNLHLLNQFLKDLEASSSGGSANDPRAAQLLNAVFSAEDATDTFLMRKEIQHIENSREQDERKDSMSYAQKMKFFCSHKKKASYPNRFAEKIKKFNDKVRRLEEKIRAETSNQINEVVVLLIPQPIRNDGQSGGNEIQVVDDQQHHVESGDIDEIQVVDDQQHRVVSTEVIAVVGEGGSGKTTLATSVYNRIDVKRHFTIRAWVRIPSVFRVREVLVDLLAQVDKYELVDATLSKDALTRRLIKLLEGTRFLIVLDDIYENLEVWESLVTALSSPSQLGGKIIIIVRNTDNLPPNGYSPLNICKLNHEESWKLFLNKVRRAEEDWNNNSELITLKWQILNKCGGLPSTIVLLGGLLSTKSFAEWEEVLKRKGHILALSYQDLDSKVKPCFLYMRLFPKRFEIPVRRLIHLWCAEGFVPEDDAERCMEELITRNMVQVGWRLDGSPKTCCMPNVLYDFCSEEEANVGFLYQSSQTLPRQQEVSFRRLAAYVDINYLPSSLSCIQNTRSYVAFDTRVPITPNMGINEFLGRITGKRGFGLLRVLDVEGVYRPFLSSDQIGRLFLLTYLSLRSTSIDHLPGWVGNMPYLETLDVKHTNIISFSLRGANKLRHLYLNNTSPDHLPDSTNLRTLKGLKWCGNITQWTGLTKLGLLLNTIATTTENEGIAHLTKLQSLKLKLIYKVEVNSTCRVSVINLSSLAEHQRLQELYLLAVLPKSVINVGFLPPNLRKLTLSLSQLEEDPMPVLGKLPHLNILRLLSRSYQGEEMTCLSRGFPKLHLLKLWDLLVLRVWTVEEGAMPCLRELEIRKCEILELPQQGLQNVTALKELVLTNMPRRFGAAVEQSLQGRDVYITKNSRNSDPFPATAREAELKDPKGKGIVGSEQTEEDSATPRPITTVATEIAPDPALQTKRSDIEEADQLKLALARSLIDTGVRSTGGPLIDEATTQTRVVEERALREATAREAELKDPKGKGIVGSEQAEEDSE